MKGQAPNWPETGSHSEPVKNPKPKAWIESLDCFPSSITINTTIPITDRALTSTAKRKPASAQAPVLAPFRNSRELGPDVGSGAGVCRSLCCCGRDTETLGRTLDWGITVS